MFTLFSFDDLSTISKEEIRKNFGGKFLGLYEAKELGIQIPLTLALSTEAHHMFLKTNPSKEISAFKKEAVAFIKSHGSFDRLDCGPFAVRSSGQGEDSSKHSFAGVFETKLDVKKEEMAEAIAFVWSSPLLAKAQNYSQNHFLMGVLIQPMIAAKFSGICFSSHPSPQTIFENEQIVVEFAESRGDRVVGGEVIPLRLVGHSDVLSSVSEYEWMEDLLHSVFELKEHDHHEIDIEFVIDQRHQFWMLQQRPISKVYPSKVLDLTGYQRMYKRSLLSLDIEMLIDGCSRFLAPYLEISIDLERWMVMTTNTQGVQELWIEKILNKSMMHTVMNKLEQDPSYLLRIESRYRDHHNRLTGDQPRDLFEWFEWMTPFTAHYYVPMIIIEALHTSILREIRHIDLENSEKELFDLSTTGIGSLMDLLNSELHPLKGRSFEECDSKLKEIAKHFGFMKCREPFEDPYTPEEFYEIAQDVPDPTPTEIREDDKYFQKDSLKKRFSHLREWMRIRNQEMEYLLYAYLKAKDLIKGTCKKLSISEETFWRSTKESLISKKPIQVDVPTILQCKGHSLISDKIEVHMRNESNVSELKGRTVFGSGKIEATVFVAFTVEELKNPPKRPCVLVTGMTTPDFVPLIRKYFDALITDEGGILCHAAIVARETPISCIVGTGFGSDLLKTGMKVSIDFDRGEINWTLEKSA